MTTEEDRGQIDGVLDSIQGALAVVRINNRIDAMWDPSLADPEIHFEDSELDKFLGTFAEDERGARIRTWIEGGARCEVLTEGDACVRMAVGSIDFHGGTIEDSMLVCREDVRPVYAGIMNDAVRLQGLSSDITINGKAIPKPQP